jgi:predicted transcriptional regulator
MQMRLSREELFLLLEESQQQNEAVEMEVEECRVAIENYKNIKEQLEKVFPQATARPCPQPVMGPL